VKTQQLITNVLHRSKLDLRALYLKLFISIIPVAYIL